MLYIKIIIEVLNEITYFMYQATQKKLDQYKP